MSFLAVPTVDFRSGYFYGHSAVREADGRQTPHGVGSYIDESGRVLYAGRWFNGEGGCNNDDDQGSDLKVNVWRSNRASELDRCTCEKYCDST